MASKYTYTKASLLGPDGKVSPVNCIYAAAKVLKGKRLTSQSINSALDALQGIADSTGMEAMEAIVFVPVFERDLVEASTGIADLANYFDCPVLDVMMYYSFLEGLEKRGYLTSSNGFLVSPLKRKYRVDSSMLEAILHRGEARREHAPEKQRAITQLDFCQLVDRMILSRNKEEIDTQELLGNVASMESGCEGFELVKTLKDKDISIENRVLFYKICYGYISYHDHQCDITRMMDDIFDRTGDRVTVRSSILQLENPLIKEEWIEGVGEDSVRLTSKGAHLLLGDKADSFVKSTTGLDCYGFATEVNRIYQDADSDRPGFFREIESKLFRLEMSNYQLGFIEKLDKMGMEDLDKFLFYMVCYECMEGDSFQLSHLSEIYPRTQSVKISRQFISEEHPLQKNHLVEHSKQGYFDDSVLTLTDKGKQLFFGEDAKIFMEKQGGKDYILPEKIAHRQLYFSEKRQSQLDLLQKCLIESHFAELRKRLEDKGMQKGIAALLYGPPGTGKTESVMQIAKATGRAVFHVDISSTKSCWFGESEKLIKGVFKKYEDLCSNSEMRPILLFNEADGIFSKRKDSNSSNVAQTENAIQNIILEEMERLDGILIATTNRANDLDGAFERRFLFKIKFDMPILEARKSIWLSKMPYIADDDASSLASGFAFSGGEIDNVVRKATMMEVINGALPDLEELRKLCREEKLSGGHTRIGFMN